MLELSIDTRSPQLCYLSVTNNQELRQLCQLLPTVPTLALDCEFIRRTTFRPIPALLQLAWIDPSHLSKNRLALIDPLGITDWQPLQQYFADTSRTHPIIMHSASEDIQVLHQLGIDDFNLFDTQLAIALTDGIDSIGYSKLVMLKLGTQLNSSTSVQRSNWLQRPLSEAQRHYALLDVVYLFPLYQKLSQRLATLDRDNWHEQECTALIQTRKEAQPETAWWNIKGGNRVEYKLARARMQILASWREQHASRLNLARGMLLPDDRLISAALRPKEIRKHIAASNFSRKIEAAITEQLEQQLAHADEQQAPEPKRLSINQINRLKQLQKDIAILSENLNIPPRFLANKHRLISWVRGEQVNFGKWQTPLLASTLAGHLHKQPAE